MREKRELTQQVLTFRSNRKDPLHEQAAERIRKYIVRQRLKPGDAMPRLQDLCEYLGLSYVTVHKALAVLARKGLLQPIRGKGTFVTNRGGSGHGPGQIGLLSVASCASLLAAGYRLDIFRGIVGTAAPEHVDVRLFSLRVPRERLTDRELRQMEIDGLLVMELTDATLLRRFVRAGVPVVVADSCLPDIPLDYVVCDNEGAAGHVVRHLVELGHRRIHYVEGYTTHPITEERVGSWDAAIRHKFYESAMVQAGLLPVFHEWKRERRGQHDDPAFESLARTLTSGQDRPTAVVAYDCAIAHRMVGAFERVGVMVPRDVSVVAVAGLLEAEMGHKPLLTHCSFDFRGMGVQATRILLDRFRNPGAPMTQATIHRVGYAFVAGDTAAPPRLA